MERVVFHSNGLKLVGVFHAPRAEKSSCIVTCHGLFASKDGPKYVELAEMAVERGFALFRFDFRGCGESEGVVSSLLDRVLEERLRDLDAAINALGNRVGDLLLFGSSAGGCIAILRACEDDRVRAVATSAAPVYRVGRYDVLEAVKKLKKPLLVIHGTRDEVVPPSSAKTLYQAANEPKKLLMVEGGDHVFSDAKLRRLVLEEVLAWFEKYPQPK